MPSYKSTHLIIRRTAWMDKCDSGFDIANFNRKTGKWVSMIPFHMMIKRKLSPSQNKIILAKTDRFLSESIFGDKGLSKKDELFKHFALNEFKEIVVFGNIIIPNFNFLPRLFGTTNFKIACYPF